MTPVHIVVNGIAHALKGNLCRCTGYSHIVDAIQHASRHAAATPRR